MPECATIIERNTVSFACALERGHTGPHSAREDPRSQRERTAWEKEQENAALATSMAGKPQTTAERHTVNPTPHPGTICPPCFEAKHMDCRRRADLIAYVFHGNVLQGDLCGCFNADTAAHGITSVDELLAERGEVPPEPLSAASLEALGFKPVPPAPLEPVSEEDRQFIEDGLLQAAIGFEEEDIPEPGSVESALDRIALKVKTLQDRGDLTDEQGRLLILFSELRGQVDRDRLVELAEDHIREEAKEGQTLDLHQVVVHTVNLVLDNLDALPAESHG